MIRLWDSVDLVRPILRRMRRWSAGDTVLWRTGRDGRVWSAQPMTVVRDTEELVALCIRRVHLVLERGRRVHRQV